MFFSKKTKETREVSNETNEVSDESEKTSEASNGESEASNGESEASNGESEASNEMTDKKFRDLISSSYEYIGKYIKDNPRIFYKGVPLIIAIYILFPVLLMTWEWLPWIWASFELYNRIPPGTIPCAINLAKVYTSNLRG